MTGTPLAPQRRHTLHFLSEARAISPVFLDTTVDMTAVNAHRGLGRRYSVVTYVLKVVAEVLAAHPDANSALRGRRRPKVAHYSAPVGKLALDKTIGGQRVVLSAVFPDLLDGTLDDIQDRVAHYRDGDPEQMPEFAGARALHKLPWPLGIAMYRLATRPLAKRERMGTFAVSSLGHRPVEGFHSVGGTTITVGLGQVADRPVVRDGQVAVASTMRLSMSFDHRAIDGAEAADVLAEIKAALEAYGVAAPDTVRSVAGSGR